MYVHFEHVLNKVTLLKESFFLYSATYMWARLKSFMGRIRPAGHMFDNPDLTGCKKRVLDYWTSKLKHSNHIWFRFSWSIQ